MLNFREFEAGPDPFGRKFTVYFKWLQTAISLRHADTIDVKFILENENGARTEKTIALPHPEILRISRSSSRPVDDAWCSRLAMRHLLYLIETGEDIEKDLITAPGPDLERYARELADSERAEINSM